jgi:hypothetical protein
MKIDGVVARPPSTKEMWFKLVDPPDSAPYVPAADAKDDDNRDTAAPVLKLADDSKSVGLGTPLQTTWDGGNGVHLILEGSEHVAGDNYKIIASFDAPNASTNAFPCEGSGGAPSTCGESPIITVWKRVYVEQHSMFQRGAFLAADAAAGDRAIAVRETAQNQAPPFQPGDVLRLLHAGAPPRHEDVAIEVTPTDAKGNPVQAIEPAGSGKWRIRIASPLANSYIKGSFGYDADAVGVANAMYVADPSALSQFYADMFVEMKPLPNQVQPEFPFMDDFNLRAGASFAKAAFLADRFKESTDRNVFQLIGASHYILDAGNTPQGAPSCSTNFGNTVPGNKNFSFVYVGTMSDVIAGPLAQCHGLRFPSLEGRSLAGLNQATVAHEITHQWHVNHDSHNDTGGHCNEHGVVPPATSGDLCLMYKTFPAGVSTSNASQIDLPRLSLHWLAHGTDSEYTQVRVHEEPVTK